MRTHIVVSKALALAALLAAPVSAQIANASAVTLGLAGNATASARGIGALSVNPAGLAMPGSGFTLALLPIQVRPGLSPIKLKDLKEFEGEVVPVATREEWLDRVATEGSQTGAVGLEVSGLALSLGRLGFQLSTVAAGNMNLSPGATEVLLFGNAGRTGAAATLSAAGSDVTAFAVSTASASFGFPLRSSTGAMAFGATVKYSVGHALLIGRSSSGTLNGEPIRVDLDFPVVLTQEDGESVQNGSGMGLDVGFQMQRGALGFGATVQNAFNTFKWDEEKLAFRPGTVNGDVNDLQTDFDEQPLAAAPTALVAEVTDLRFTPTLSAGVSFDATSDFTVSADVRNRFGEGMAVGPKLHVGAGAEFRGLRVLHLRGGAAIVTGGMQAAGGASLILGPVSLTGAGGIRNGDDGDSMMGQFTLSFGGR